MAHFRLLPRDERFFNLFEQSSEIIVKGAVALQQMLSDLPQAAEYRTQIADLEHQGDTIIHEVIDSLNRTFVTPLDHEDIRAIIGHLDDVIDFTQAAAERIVLYNVTQPNDDCRQLAGVLIEIGKNVQSLVGMLRGLRKQRKDILTKCIEVHRLENSGDKIYREGLGTLFRQGDVMELLRWKEIFEQIEQAIDASEDLADVIESVVVKHA